MSSRRRGVGRPSMRRRLLRERRTAAVVGIVVLSALASLLVTTSAGAQAQTLTEVERVPLIFTTTSVCMGEEIAVTTELQILAHVTITPDGTVLSVSRLSSPAAEGVGLSTGTTYRVINHAMSVSFFPPEPEPGPRAFEGHFQLIAPGPGNNFFFTVLTHLTIDANGEIRAEAFRLVEECR
jgi:hypothetical protein